MLDIDRTAGTQGRGFQLSGVLDASVARQLQRMLSGPASDGGMLTIDLSGLESCDAECARLLVTLTKRARVAEGELVLTSPSAAVLEVLLSIASASDLHIVEAAATPG